LRIHAAFILVGMVVLFGCADQLHSVQPKTRSAETFANTEFATPAPTPKSKPKPPRSAALLKSQSFTNSTMSTPTEQNEPLESDAEPAEMPMGQSTEATELPPPEQSAVPSPAEYPPPARFDPKSLVGLGESSIAHMLGDPSWTEDVPPAKYWQYVTPSCVLRVFFFMDMTTQNFRALSYELTSSDDAPNVDERCFAQLLAQASNHQQASDGKHLN